MILEMTRLRWERDRSSPARIYRAEGFMIIWDPAGRVEGEPGGWYLWTESGVRLGILPTLAAAKARAEAVR